MTAAIALLLSICVPCGAFFEQFFQQAHGGGGGGRRQNVQ